MTADFGMYSKRGVSDAPFLLLSTFRGGLSTSINPLTFIFAVQ